MKEDDNSRARKVKHEAHTERLAVALRANLARRKEQTRARARGKQVAADKSVSARDPSELT